MRQPRAIRLMTTVSMVRGGRSADAVAEGDVRRGDDEERDRKADEEEVAHAATLQKDKACEFTPPSIPARALRP
jgi:hypothetical protein